MMKICYLFIHYLHVIGREHNFKKAQNIDSLGVEYDPKSVMHYSR